jgi:hypothetical protein
VSLVGSLYFLGFDISKPEGAAKAAAFVAFMRENGVKESTDEHGRKVVLWGRAEIANGVNERTREDT